MTTSRLFMQEPAIDELIHGMARITRHRLARRGMERPAMVGIHTGGVWVARRLAPLLDIEPPLGELDISFYRDDFTRIGMNPQVKPSHIPFEVEGRHILLVDDVIQSGRTVRAAMNEIFDYGRPASIFLVTLIERPRRELPIQPDVSGLEPTLDEREQVRLAGPDPLELRIEAPGGRRR